MLPFALCRVPQLDRHAAMIMGTIDRQNKVRLQPIYDQIDTARAESLINWYVRTTCDTTGHINGKGKRSCFPTFLASSPDVLNAISGLCEGDYPSSEVLKCCD